MKTPPYIATLLQPNGKKAPSRKVWSIDLEHIWVPFFTATNVMEETSVPSEDLGAPLRLALAKDGSVRFSQTGRPALRVAPVLNSHIQMVRENFTATLINYTGKVAAEMKDAYRAQVEAAQKAALPIQQYQDTAIAEALRQQAEAEAKAVLEAAEAIPEAAEVEVAIPEAELVAA
ncbi:MAG: hypothetical protein HW388_1231 [Dehalococcoidia bacterium]|nr:hypothetical protein [Dehalococcoidia bacterium]